MFTQISDYININQTQKDFKILKSSIEKNLCAKSCFKKTNRQETQKILLAAKRYDVASKQPGKKNGPLGAIAIEILEYFVNLIDYQSGRLEPSIKKLMQKIGRSRDAVVRALNNLRNHGFIEWVRRYVKTGLHYPKVKQTSNAYKLCLPEVAKKLIKSFFSPPPLPEDIEDKVEKRKQTNDEYEKEQLISNGTTLNLSIIENDKLRLSLQNLWLNIKTHEKKAVNLQEKCESVIQTEYQSNYYTIDQKRNSHKKLDKNIN